MTAIRYLIISAALFFLLSGSPALAAQVYVEQATGSGVGPDDLNTTTELIRNTVGEVSGDQVVGSPGKADYVLQPRLLRLGEAYLLTLSKNRNGQVVSSSQLKAARMEELDKVAKRLTRSVLAGESAPANPRVGEITAVEALDGAQRRPVRKAAYLGLGGASLRNLNTTGLGFSVAGAYAWDFNQVLFKIVGEGNVNGNAFFASGGIGGNYFFSVENVAPYLTADFGAGAAKVEEGMLSGQALGGFVAGVGAGIQFMRTSAANLDLGFRAGYLFHENIYGMPAVYSVRLGLYF